MKLIGTDSDLGSKPQFATVVESSAGVDEHRCGVDFRSESIRGGIVRRHDCFGVVRAVPVNVVDRSIDTLNDL